MRLVADLARGLAESVRETLPSTSDEAGVFIAGMAWAFLIFILALLATSWLTITVMGGRP